MNQKRNQSLGGTVVTNPRAVFHLGCFSVLSAVLGPRREGAPGLLPSRSKLVTMLEAELEKFLICMDRQPSGIDRDEVKVVLSEGQAAPVVVLPSPSGVMFAAIEKEVSDACTGWVPGIEIGEFQEVASDSYASTGDRRYVPATQASVAFSIAADILRMLLQEIEQIEDDGAKASGWRTLNHMLMARVQIGAQALSWIPDDHFTGWVRPRLVASNAASIPEQALGVSSSLKILGVYTGVLVAQWMTIVAQELEDAAGRKAALIARGRELLAGYEASLSGFFALAHPGTSIATHRYEIIYRMAGQSLPVILVSPR